MTKEDFFQAQNDIRGNRSMNSNSFMSRSQLDQFLDDDSNMIVHEDGLLVLLADEPDLKRLYYYADGSLPLQKIPAIVRRSQKPVVADLVGRGDAPAKQAKLLSDIGFSQYSTFIRMSSKSVTPLPYDASIGVTKASPPDAALIVGLLREEFDPLFAHIPNADEIGLAIEKGEIDAVYRDGELAGIAYFETISSQMKCLRYFLVRNEYRGMGVGAALLMNQFRGGTQGILYYLWIGTYNKTAELYKRIGFTADGLVDYIMLYDDKGEMKNGKDL